MNALILAKRLLAVGAGTAIVQQHASADVSLVGQIAKIQAKLDALEVPPPELDRD